MIWLRATNDSSTAQDIRSTEVVKTRITSALHIIYCACVYNTSKLIPDGTCGTPGRGVKITQDVLADFFARGKDWITSAIEAGELQRRHGPEGASTNQKSTVIKYMNHELYGHFGIKGWIDVLKGASDEVKAESSHIEGSDISEDAASEESQTT